LLLLFSVASGVLGLSWLLVGALHRGSKTRHLFHLVHLAAFVLIPVAILEKSRRGPTPRIERS
jgi:hypothetical protein